MTIKALPIDGGFVVKRTPGRVHGTFESAGAEAARLTSENPDGPSFLVLKVVGVVIDAVTASQTVQPHG